MLEAVIFDMDGILIDSEPLWKRAEQEVFSAIGVEVKPELAEITASMTTSEVTRYWHQQQPWSHKSLEAVEKEVIDQVGFLVKEEGQLMDGVVALLQFFQDKNWPIGLATNAPYRLIPIILEHTGIRPYFSALSSAEHEAQGKPHPAVYLSTARKLGVDPSKCLVFEDSESGIIAAQAALMKTVAVPAPADFDHPKFDKAMLKVKSLSYFLTHHGSQIAQLGA